MVRYRMEDWRYHSIPGWHWKATSLTNSLALALKHQQDMEYRVGIPTRLVIQVEG